MKLDSILSSSPWIEVSIKYLYWHFEGVNKLLSKIAKNKNKVKVSQSGSISFQAVLDKIRLEGVSDNSILIVHSSGSALKSTGLSSSELCKSLIEFVKNGTLVMPAIPIFKGQPSGGISRLSSPKSDEVITYDVRKSKVSTGALPQALLKIDGAFRSSHPLNTVVTFGKSARYLIEDDIVGEMPLPCGTSSSWKKCLDQNAYILFLGIDAAHSMTMIHVAEDSWESEWPIHNWYRKRPFKIIDGDDVQFKTVRERKPYWSIFFAERTLQKDLIRKRILKQFNVDGMHFELLSSKDLIEFLRSKKPSTYPYFIPSFFR
jgi:aminoglycoside 3-N-acetyltransferase